MSRTGTMGAVPKVKEKPVYKPVKIPKIVKYTGYTTLLFLLFCYIGMLIGSFLGLEATNPDLVLGFKIIGVVAGLLNMGCWYLADGILSGNLEK